MAFDKASYGAEYLRTHYDRITIYMPKGKLDELKAAAEAANMTVNDFIKASVYKSTGLSLW